MYWKEADIVRVVVVVYRNITLRKHFSLLVEGKGAQGGGGGQEYA